MIFYFVKGPSRLFLQDSTWGYPGNPYSLKATGYMGYNLSIYRSFRLSLQIFLIWHFLQEIEKVAFFSVIKREIFEPFVFAVRGKWWFFQQFFLAWSSEGNSGVNPIKLWFLRFSYFLLSLAILKYRHYFCVLQTLKLKNKKRKKSLFYKEKSLVGLTPDVISFRPYFYQNSRLPRTYRVLHPSEICSYILEQYPQRHRGADLFPGGAAAPSSAPLLAYGTTRQHFAAATTGERKLTIFYNVWGGIERIAKIGDAYLYFQSTLRLNMYKKLSFE